MQWKDYSVTHVVVYNVQQIINCIHTWFLAVEAGWELDEISDCRS